MPFDRPLILDSYADYFIVGAYATKPFQVDIFERTKVNKLSIDTEKEVRRSL